MGIASAWLDGEIVAMDAKGNASFQLLQNAFDSSMTVNIVYFVFDIPHFGGYDLTRVPLEQHRAHLRKIFSRLDHEQVRSNETLDAPVKQLLESACRKG